ncbi:MAG: hypothetical protein UT50_C0027G0009 [Candidatus Moranbacteria bacterium GW2011_GWA2_39_41]|nr:MAG: hypothetical protein UT50_C0027G0009 [Candidatus Moranbacteria bacterium GW2011_GWA2_39_41]
MQIKYWTKFIRRHLKLFKRVFLHKNNLKRDALIIFFSVVVAVIFVVKAVPNRSADLVNSLSLVKTVETGKTAILSEEIIAEEVHAVQGLFNIDQWKDYRSQWYGFEIKYPETWSNPITHAAVSGSNWEYKYQFNKKNINDLDVYAGFDLIVYNLAKTKEISNTDEFPSIKNSELISSGQCQDTSVNLIETGDYPAEEIYVPQSDECYNSTLFFSFTRGEYIYNLVPFAQPGVVTLGDPQVEIMDNFPEFFAVASSLKTIDIVRPKPVVVAPKPKPKAFAPMPLSFKRTSNGLECAHKNDQPSKSKQNKSKHLDMECCLDPDEYPNPNCHYSESKYGKYL